MHRVPLLTPYKNAQGTPYKNVRGTPCKNVPLLYKYIKQVLLNNPQTPYGGLNKKRDMSVQFLKSYESVFNTDLTLVEKCLLSRVISFSKDRLDFFASMDYLCKKFSCDIRTLRKAKTTLQEKGLIEIVKETGKTDVILPKKENINKFLGCDIFQENKSAENNNGRTGVAPSADYLNKLYANVK